MSKHLASLRRHRLVAIGIVLTCLIFLVASVWASTRMWATPAGTTQEIKPLVINKTNSLRVVSMEKTKGQFPDLKVTLFNSSNKIIYAYILSVGDMGIMTYSRLNQESFAAGQTKIDKIPFGNFEAAAAEDPSRAGELVVSAVYFDDHTGEGEARHLEMIKDNYAGIKDQLKLLLPLLHSALSSAKSDLENALLTLESEASRLPTERGNVKLSADYRGGRAWVQESLSMEIQNLNSMRREYPNFDFSLDLKKLVESYERLFAKL